MIARTPIGELQGMFETPFQIIFHVKTPELYSANRSSQSTTETNVQTGSPQVAPVTWSAPLAASILARLRSPTLPTCLLTIESLFKNDPKLVTKPTNSSSANGSSSLFIADWIWNFQKNKHF